MDIKCGTCKVVIEKPEIVVEAKDWTIKYSLNPPMPEIVQWQVCSEKCAEALCKQLQDFGWICIKTRRNGI
jgi:hypothetical protein